MYNLVHVCAPREDSDHTAQMRSLTRAFARRCINSQRTKILSHDSEVREMAKIRKRYNQIPRLTQDTTWESNKKYNKHHQ